MEEQFVTYENAVALKEIGFDKYSWFGMVCSLYEAESKHTFYANGIGDETYISAPLKSQVFDWFRKKYKIDSYIIPIGINKRFYDFHIYFENNEEIKGDGNLYKTYEEAESACIDKLIKIIKNK